jgi:hypothetical protein
VDWKDLPDCKSKKVDKETGKKVDTTVPLKDDLSNKDKATCKPPSRNVKGHTISPAALAEKKWIDCKSIEADKKVPLKIDNSNWN